MYRLTKLLFSRGNSASGSANGSDPIHKHSSYLEGYIKSVKCTLTEVMANENGEFSNGRETILLVQSLIYRSRIFDKLIYLQIPILDGYDISSECWHSFMYLWDL